MRASLFPSGKPRTENHAGTAENRPNPRAARSAGCERIDHRGYEGVQPKWLFDPTERACCIRARSGSAIRMCGDEDRADVKFSKNGNGGINAVISMGETYIHKQRDLGAGSMPWQWLDP